MKYITVLIVLFFGYISTANAQNSAEAKTSAMDTTIVPAPWKDITLGPIFSAGAAVDAGNVAMGAKTSSAFAFSAGADGEVPITQTFAFNLGLVYDQRGINFHQQNNDNNEVDYTLGYFNIRPEFRFSGLMIGIGLGIPVSASFKASGYVNPAPNIGTSALSTLFELRLGGEIPILTTDLGTLDFTLEASYAFSKIVSNGPLPYFDAAQSYQSTDNNGPLASGEIGVKYLFDLTRN